MRQVEEENDILLPLAGVQCALHGEKKEKLKVCVVGGSGVGLTTALLLENYMGDRVEITLYESRIKKNANGTRFVWKDYELDGNRRREQVVTVQQDVYDLFADFPKLRDIFTNEENTENVWGYSRNIAISDIEDHLLELANDSSIKIKAEKVKEGENVTEDEKAESFDEKFYQQFDIIIGADGASSFTRRSFSNENIKNGFEWITLGSTDPELYVETDFSLGIALANDDWVRNHQSLFADITLAQTRYLLNSRSGAKGYLNIRLTPEEYETIYQVAKGCPFSRPIELPKEYGEKGIDSFPLPIKTLILDGLKLYGFTQDHIKNIVGIPLTPAYADRFAIKLENGPYVCLVGDAAISHHFWPGRGLNTGLKSAVAIARATWRGSYKTCIEHNIITRYNSFMQELRVREMQGRSGSMMRKDLKLPKLCNTILHDNDEVVALVQSYDNDNDRENIIDIFKERVNTWSEFNTGRRVIDELKTARDEETNKFLKRPDRPKGITFQILLESGASFSLNGNEMFGWPIHLQRAPDVSPGLEQFHQQNVSKSAYMWDSPTCLQAQSALGNVVESISNVRTALDLDTLMRENTDSVLLFGAMEIDRVLVECVVNAETQQPLKAFSKLLATVSESINYKYWTNSFNELIKKITPDREDVAEQILLVLRKFDVTDRRNPIDIEPLLMCFTYFHSNVKILSLLCEILSKPIHTEQQLLYQGRLSYIQKALQKFPEDVSLIRNGFNALTLLTKYGVSVEVSNVGSFDFISSSLIEHFNTNACVLAILRFIDESKSGKMFLSLLYRLLKNMIPNQGEPLIGECCTNSIIISICDIVSDLPHNVVMDEQILKLLMLENLDFIVEKHAFNGLLKPQKSDTLEKLVRETLDVEIVTKFLRKLRYYADDKVNLMNNGAIGFILKAMGIHENNENVQEHACAALMHLAVNDDNKVNLMNNGAIGFILKAMENHENNADVQRFACAALRNLAVNDDNKVTLMNNDAIGFILKAMGIHEKNENVQEEACAALRSLAVNDDNQVTLMNNGAIDLIKKAMEIHENNENVQEHACRALRNLAVNDDNKVNLMNNGAIGFILKAMENHENNADVQRFACAALRNLAVNDDNKVTLMNNDAIGFILKAMGIHEKNENVQEEACAALRSLAVNDDNQVTLMNNGAIGFILKAMGIHEKNENVQEYACGALRNLAINIENEVTLMNNGAIGLILKAMKDHKNNKNVQEHACAALRNLAVNVDNKVTLMNNDAIGFILKAMGIHEKNENVQEEACAALRSLAVNDDNQVTLMNNGAIGFILKAMENHENNADVQRFACAALRNLAINIENKVTLMNNGAIGLILKAMKDHEKNGIVQEHAFGALRNLASNTNNKEMLVEKGAVKLLNRVMENHATYDLLQQYARETLDLLR